MEFINDVTIPLGISKWVTLEEKLESLNSRDCKEVSDFIQNSFKDHKHNVLQMINTMQKIRPLQIDSYVKLISLLKYPIGSMAQQEGCGENGLFFNKLCASGYANKGVFSKVQFYESSKLIMNYGDGDDINNYDIPACFSEYLTNNTTNISKVVEEIRKNGYPEGSIEYALKFDNLDQLMDIIIEEGKDVNDNLSFNGIDYDKNENVSALSFAAFYGSVKCFRYLICRGLQIDENVCRFAVCGGNYEILRLCEQNGGNFGYALPYAIRYHRNDIADWMMLSQSLDDLSLDEAYESFNIKAILRDMQADPTKSIFAAAKYGVTEFIEFLLERGVDPAAEDDEGMTALHYAAFGDHPAALKMLIKAGADVDLANDSEWTPLIVAARYGSAKAMGALINAGAVVDAEDKAGMTPLHYAAQEGHTKAVCILLDNGADVNAKDEDGRTPIELAAAMGQVDVVNFLVEFGAAVELPEEVEKTPENIIYHYQCGNGLIALD